MSPWSKEIEMLPELGCRLRAVTTGDEEALTVFALKGLSERSRVFFAPYDWSAGARSLSEEYGESIDNSLSGRDLHLVALDGDGSIVAHGFLWSMGSSDVPELALAVADAWHGRGLGRMLLARLERACRDEGKSAIELTTMQDNARALKTYEAAGYERLGLILNPLGVDVTAAFAGEPCTPTGVTVEHHLVRVLDEACREGVMAAMAAKQARAKELFGGMVVKEEEEGASSVEAASEDGSRKRQASAMEPGE